ncbi:c-type cytochrome [Alcaligenes endophyticus]|uniref:Cytochrome c n=1 Tax=Alcaligenes endophyticus TaxID=1929088 RepID=A0ABT8EI84_9BURK|nr:cytochrome c [Alcaligenes endophyticus]MCX5592729.1 cytochrome c [Alcaligenes endophyticus]MDN4120917.1 cytochrome c [Alcaligenes endophyticus]
MKKRILITAISAVMVAVATPASAQFAKPEQAISYRQASMALIGSHFGRMAPVAKKEVPFDAAAIAANVEVLSVLAQLPWAAFGAGTEGGDTKPEAWSDAAGFKKDQDDFLGAIEKLQVASKSGDFDAFRVAFGNVGKSCKTCHDAYRKEK